MPIPETNPLISDEPLPEHDLVLSEDLILVYELPQDPAVYIVVSATDIEEYRIHRPLVHSMLGQYFQGVKSSVLDVPTGPKTVTILHHVRTHPFGEGWCDISF